MSNADLQNQEIVRLNKIIGVLLEQNDQLKKEVSLLRFGDGNNPAISSNSSLPNDENQKDYSNKETSNENYPLDSSHPNSNKGNYTSDTSNKDIADGKKPTVSFHQQLEINENNIEKLAGHIPYKGRRTGRKNIAHILLHVHNGGGGSHGTLGTLTGLGRSGIAKCICYMKKRGLLERNGFQQFKLTPKSLDWIEQSGVK